MPVHNFDGEHYWEIGKFGYPLKKIVEDIQRAGFEVKKTYRVLEFPYHRFFVLRKLKRSESTQSSDLWPEMGRYGRKFVEKHYDIRRLNKRLVEIYRNLIK